MESVINFIISKFPEIATLLVVAILVWRISVVYHKAKQRLEAVESGIKSLPCEKHEERIEGHAAMKATLDSINEQVLQISKWILRIDNSADTVGALVQKYSPRRMTPFGISLFKLSGADIVVADNEAFFLEEVQRLNPATPYDVEQASLDVVFSNLGNAMFNSIKNYIYYQPEKVELTGKDGEKKEIRISLMAIAQLMSLDIRDRYLAHHPEITMSSEEEAVGEMSRHLQEH